MVILISTYLVLSGITATRAMGLLPENRSMLVALVLGLSWPLEVAMLFLYYFYKMFGINLQFSFSILLTKEERKKMTDDFMQKFSDELQKMEDNIKNNDEK